MVAGYDAVYKISLHARELDLRAEARFARENWYTCLTLPDPAKEVRSGRV